MDQMTDNDIIRGILENKSHVLNEVYREYFPMVEKMILNTGGDKELAKDIFQECLIIIYKKLTKGEFTLSCRFSTYLYAVCKKIWFQEKRKRISRMKNFHLESQEIIQDPEPFQELENNRITNLFYKHFDQLSEDCQKILILHFNKIKIEEIQQIMNYQNPHYVMDRKYRCKKSLILRIMNDPNFKSIKNEYYEHVRSLF
jgi:RNA polymerase sigma factor (sigma-70 family)